MRKATKMNTLVKLPAPVERSDADWKSDAARTEAKTFYTTVRDDRIVATTKYLPVVSELDGDPEWVFEVTSLLDLRSDLKYQSRFPGTAAGYREAIQYHRSVVL